jgi:DNA polymerase-1
MTSLWGEEFDIPVDSSNTKKLIDKVKKPKNVVLSTEKVIKSKTASIEQKLEIITAEVYRILGKYKDNTIVIKTRDELHDYITKAISNGEIAIDTETNNSLQPVDCKLMGPCIYTDGMKNAYIPINHVNRNTGERLSWQLTEQDIYEEFSRLSNTNIIMHNGKFDYQVIKCTCNLPLKIYWDTMIAARILNENELANLKSQYISKIDSSIEKYSIEHLFQGLEYAIVDPEIFALYAATDAYMTYKLYKYQKQIFEKSEHTRLYDLFKNIEMKVLIPTAEMELNGVYIDKEYANRLSLKYHKELDVIKEKIDKELTTYAPLIEEWRQTESANFHPIKINKKGEQKQGKSKNEQLEDPINLGSNTQLSILFHDILKIPPIYKKRNNDNDLKTISLDEESLNTIYKEHKIKLCGLILEQRGLLKLISTYVDKIPQCIVPKTGRVHAHFNQLGADTGRFSSSDPNLQNIPSHVKSIRLMFKATPGYVMLGSDFSAQEPRILATYSKDENMVNAYNQDRDLYAVIAQKVYNNNYEDNLEFHLDGTPNPAGKKRRSNAKSILLGLMYGRGVASIAEQTGSSIEKAQEIVDKFFQEFPKVKKWIECTEQFAKDNGYVEDLWGRRRRLPDIQLPNFNLSFKNRINNDFNPLLDSKGLFTSSNNILLENYKNKLNKAKSRKEIEKIKKEAEKECINIINNGGFIARAERQCVNARIQGGAASMSKRAMIALYNDEEMRKLGFRLLIMVHDELIGECPIENVTEVKKRLAHWMEVAGKPEVTLPMKCDVAEFSHWYLDELSAEIKDKHEELKEKALTEQQIFNSLHGEYEELTEDQLRDILYN